MDPEKAELDSSCRNGSSSQVVLYGEFTGTPRKVRYALSLSERDLTVQKVPSQNKVVFSLKDCIGCRAHGGDDTADTGAYFSAYFYPLKRRWMMSSGGSRQRVELCYRVSGVPGVSGVQEDPCANLAEAERWALVIRERAARQQHLRKGLMFSELRRPCRVMLLVNPQSGNGQALTLYNSHVQRMLHEAGVPHTLVITERQNHARELAREADLSQWDALVIMSGDGLLFEVINGLLERADWEEAIRTPLGILPGGSGNALAASIHNYSGAAQVFGEELLVSCGFILCKGLVSPMDLASVHLSSSPRVFSFLSLAWGFVADVDVESEKYRHVGSARFTVGTLVRLASLRVYQGRLAYLPAADKEYKEEEEEEGGLLDKHTIPNKPLSFCPASLGRQPSQDSPDHTFHNSCNSNNSPYVRRTDDGTPSRNATKALNGPPDSLLSPLDQPVPSDWVVVQEESFVLMLAMYQSHLAEDLMAAPGAVPDEGVIHLFYVREGISRTALLRLFLAMEKGNHLTNNCQHLTYVRARALRLEPHSTKGVITVDGEVVEYGPVQAQIHRGMARLITG